MTVVWCDTETTGLYPIDSGAFEIAFLVYWESQFLAEKVFHLNPLSDEVLFHEEAFRINGISEDIIRSYPLAKEIIPKMVEFFEEFKPSEEKMVFAGYKCDFDYGHIGALLSREGYAISDYFDGRFIDVLELVKKAKEMRILDTENNQLTTLTKSLEIPHEGGARSIGGH
jgi:DNA polymerase III epsilon subunit-like protein